MGYGDKMKITTSKLTDIIKEELINELSYIDPDEAGVAINNALDDLTRSLKKVRNPEKWAEKYHRSLPGVIDMIERLTRTLGKMKQLLMKQNQLYNINSLKQKVKKLEQKPNSCCRELEKRVKAIELELENFKFRFSDFILQPKNSTFFED